MTDKILVRDAIDTLTSCVEDLILDEANAEAAHTLLIALGTLAYMKYDPMPPLDEFDVDSIIRLGISEIQEERLDDATAHVLKWHEKLTKLDDPAELAFVEDMLIVYIERREEVELALTGAEVLSGVRPQLAAEVEASVRSFDECVRPLDIALGRQGAARIAWAHPSMQHKLWWWGHVEKYEDNYGVFAYTAILHSILERSAVDANDLVSLTATGESLRRRMLLAGWERTPKLSRETMGWYDTTLPLLKHLADEVANGLDADLETQLERLRAFAHEPSLTRSVSEGADTLHDIEEVLEVAAGCGRAGALTVEQVTTLGDRAFEVVDALTPKLHDLWNVSARIGYGPDEMYPSLYSWADPLVSLSKPEFDLIDMLRKCSKDENN